MTVWSEKGDGRWQAHLLNDFGAPVWRISWSIAGGLLSVSDAKATATVWKESDGKWQQIVG